MNPYYQQENVTIYHADMVDLRMEIEPGSIDAVITDPPYPRKYYPVWDDLGWLSKIVLKRGGSLLSIVPHYLLPAVLREMEDHEPLKYRWICAMWQHDGAHPRMAMGIEVHWKPIVWWVQGAWPQGRGYRGDGFTNTPPIKALHKWEQSMDWAAYCLKFVPPGQYVLECSHDKRHTGTTSAVRPLRAGVQAPQEGVTADQQILQPRVLGGGEQTTAGGLPGMRSDHDPEQEPQALLQPALREPLDGTPPGHDHGAGRDTEGVRPDTAAGSSVRDQGRVCDGASSRDGADSGTVPHSRRGRPSPERDQGRQPRGEPAGAAEAGPRWDEEARAGGRVPVLRPPVPGQGQCAVCGAVTIAIWQPSLVVDPFCGSGTLVVAARDQGFKVIGIDIDEDACATTVARLEGRVS